MYISITISSNYKTCLTIKRELAQKQLNGRNVLMNIKEDLLKLEQQNHHFITNATQIYIPLIFNTQNLAILDAPAIIKAKNQTS